MRSLRFKEYAQPYLVTESVGGSVDRIANKLKNLFQSKLGYVLARWPGLDHFVNGEGAQQGIKFYLGDTGAAVRFNIDHTDGKPDIESIDIWSPNSKHPVSRITGLATDVVLSAADQIAAAIKGAEKFIGKSLKLPQTALSESVLAEMAKAVEYNGVTYPTQTKAIEAMLQAGHKPADVARMLGASSPTVYQVANRMGISGRTHANITVVAGSEEQSTDPDARQAIRIVSAVKYADPETVFEDVINLADMVILGVNNSLIVCGEKGIGKTTEITNRIKAQIEAGNIQENEVKYISGAKLTEKGLFELLFTNYNKLIVFDDSDSVMKSVDKVNMLKSALDTREPRKIEWYSSSSKASGMFDPETVSEDEYAKKIEAGQLPNNFVFTGRVIFISNLGLDDIDEAIRSRSFVFDIRLKLTDKWNLIATKLNALCSNDPEVTDEDRQKAFNYMRDEYEGDPDLRSLVKGIKLVTTFRRTGASEESLLRMMKMNL